MCYDVIARIRRAAHQEACVVGEIVAMPRQKPSHIQAVLPVIRQRDDQVVCKLRVVPTVVHLEAVGRVEHVVADVVVRATIVIVNACDVRDSVRFCRETHSWIDGFGIAQSHHAMQCVVVLRDISMRRVPH